MNEEKRVRTRISKRVSGDRLEHDANGHGPHTLFGSLADILSCIEPSDTTDSLHAKAWLPMNDYNDKAEERA